MQENYLNSSNKISTDKYQGSRDFYLIQDPKRKEKTNLSLLLMDTRGIRITLPSTQICMQELLLLKVGRVVQRGVHPIPKTT